MRCALVTGIGGFLGAGLADGLLASGVRVVGLIRDSAGQHLLEDVGLSGRVDIVRGSITEPGLVARVLAEYEVDSVFHLAAQTLVGVAARSPVGTFESNILGTWQVLESSRQCSSVERVVVASSDKAYGDQEELPYTEETPLNGLYPYDASKVCTDVLARSYAATYDLPVAVTRCANIYGPGDTNWSRLVPGTIRAVVTGVDPVIRSDGTPERDYLYLTDAVAGYLALADQLPGVAGEAFNFGTAQPISASAVVDQVIKAAGASDKLSARIEGSATNEIDRQWLSCDKAQELLGWTPSVTLTDGLKNTLPWYERYLTSTRGGPAAS